MLVSIPYRRGELFLRSCPHGGIEHQPFHHWKIRMSEEQNVSNGESQACVSSQAPAELSHGAANGGPHQQPAPHEPRWRIILCFLLMLAAIQLVLGPKLRLSQWTADAESNAAIAEGIAWHRGRLDLPHKEGIDLLHARMHDTAYYNGKVYNAFPPMVSFLTFLINPALEFLGVPEGLWLPVPYVQLVFWPLPIVGFIVFRRQVRDSAWAALLTLAWMGGTALLPNLHECQTGYLGQMDHVMSQVGLLIFAADLLGRQRIWPALIGLAISTYTRQLTFLYGLPLLWLAWRQGRKRLLACALGLLVVAAPLLLLNWLKFGSPLEFGYRYIYAGRQNDYMGERALTYGVFSTHFIPDSAYYMFVAPPAIDVSPTQIYIHETNPNGTSLWMTTPLAISAVVFAAWWWRDKARRLLMFGTLPVIFGLLCYHSPGYMEHGYNRFVLDFLPIWLLVIAPRTRNGWRTWFTIVCTAWSLLYFQAIVPDSPTIGPRSQKKIEPPMPPATMPEPSARPVDTAEIQ
jgi:hypothetical protein